MQYTDEISEVLGPELEYSESTKIPHYGRRQARKISKHEYSEAPDSNTINFSFLVILIVFIFIIYIIYLLTKSNGLLEIPILILGIGTIITGWIFYYNNRNKYYDHILGLVILTLLTLLVILTLNNILEFKHHFPLFLLMLIGILLIETYITIPTRGCWYFSLIILISIVISAIIKS